jgi:hypothetical protein
LNDIKTKLDALSRKELKYSYVSLKEGVDLLYVSLDKSNELDQKAAKLKRIALKYQGYRTMLSLTS